MSDTAITGGCHCGALRYAIEGDLGFSFACFCTSCRKLSAGARLTGVAIKEAKLTVQGSPSRYTYPGGKDDIVLEFCSTCGTQISAIPKAYPGIVSLRIGTLDNPQIIRTLKPVHAEEACHWELGLS